MNYFVKVIGRRPSQTRYQWLYQIVQCIVRKDPYNNRILRNWVQQTIRGRKDKKVRVPACVKTLWRGRLGQKPTYNDLASIVRFAMYNRRITYRGLYLFTWSVLNEDKPAVKTGHTEFWKKYAGVRSMYVSGLQANHKFMIFNSHKKIAVGTTLRTFKKVSNNNYFFFDETAKAIRWLGNAKLHLGVHGGLRQGARVRLVKARKEVVRRQDMFTYDSADMKFHNYVNKDLCITFRRPNVEGEQMVLSKCNCGKASSTQELLVKYFKFDKNNGFKPY